jgi:hypothetical protein
MVAANAMNRFITPSIAARANPAETSHLKRLAETSS